MRRFAAVYDGHEGDQAATQVAAYLHKEIKHSLASYRASRIQRCSVQAYLLTLNVSENSLHA